MLSWQRCHGSVYYVGGKMSKLLEIVASSHSLLPPVKTSEIYGTINKHHHLFSFVLFVLITFYYMMAQIVVKKDKKKTLHSVIVFGVRLKNKIKSEEMKQWPKSDPQDYHYGLHTIFCSWPSEPNHSYCPNQIKYGMKHNVLCIKHKSFVLLGLEVAYCSIYRFIYILHVSSHLYKCPEIYSNHSF